MQTRFRAYQLSTSGSLFSYWKDNTFTLIEARLPKSGLETLEQELAEYSKTRIDSLHITSWDTDHCNLNDLTQIINHLRPNLIEIPSYDPTSVFGKECKKLILKYDDIHQKYVNNVSKFDKSKIAGLMNGTAWGTNNIVYHSLYNVDNHNDMSQIRLFRSLGFNVLSLGDCESEEITKNLMTKSFIKNEVDVLILPHHGSENSMLNADFLDYCKPSLAICSSNYDNEYSHPRESVKQLLKQKNVELITTKRGDAIVLKNKGYKARGYDLISDNQQTQKIVNFNTKRYLAS